MAKQYIIVTNYLNKTKTEYVSGYDRAFSEDGLSTGFQIENYLCDVVGDTGYGKLTVKAGKQVAAQLGIRAKDASAISVSEASKQAIVKHFKPELNKTMWVIGA